MNFKREGLNVAAGDLVFSRTTLEVWPAMLSRGSYIYCADNAGIHALWGVQVGPDAGHGSVNNNRMMMEFFIESLAVHPERLLAQ